MGAEGSWGLLASAMEMSPGSPATCVSGLALSPSGCDTSDKSSVSLGPVLSLLLMNRVSTQRQAWGLQVARNCQGWPRAQDDGSRTKDGLHELGWNHKVK